MSPLSRNTFDRILLTSLKKFAKAKMLKNWNWIEDESVTKRNVSFQCISLTIWMHLKKKKKVNLMIVCTEIHFHSLRAFWLSTLILFRTMHRENEVFSYFMCFSNTSFCLHLSIVTKWEPVRCSHTWWCSIFGWSFCVCAVCVPVSCCSCSDRCESTWLLRTSIDFV